MLEMLGGLTVDDTSVTVVGFPCANAAPKLRLKAMEAAVK